MSTESEQAMKAFMERIERASSNKGFMKRIRCRSIDARLDTIDARLDRVDKTFLNVYAARHHRSPTGSWNTAFRLTTIADQTWSTEFLKSVG
jgi:hypothetical protein